MPIIEWNANSLVGIQEIDRQHKRLVSCLNRTYDQFRNGKDIDEAFLQELVGYSAGHFTCEEKWMADSGYPGLTAHQEEHAEFKSKICEFSKGYKREARISVELLWFLCNWVTHHIQETDAAFGRFLARQNLSGGQPDAGTTLAAP